MLRLESETGWWLVTHPDHARRDANRLALERGENGGSYHRRKDHGGNSEPEMPVLVPLGFEIVGMLAGVHPPMPRREQLLHFRSPAVCVAYVHARSRRDGTGLGRKVHQ